MNLKKNQTLVTVIVLFIAIGLVAAYVPFLFPQTQRRPQPTDQAPSPTQTATLAPQPAEEEVIEESEIPVPDIASDTSLEESDLETIIPEGFGGLEEESELLGELDGLLEGLE